MELRYLTQNHYVDERQTTGFMRQLPLSIQHISSGSVIDHYSSDPERLLTATLRSCEDLTFFIETVGVAFAFSSASYSATMKKGLDLYLLMLTPPLVNSLKPLQTDRREIFLCNMVRQMTLLLDVRTDYPAGTAQHIPLIGAFADHLAAVFAACEKLNLSEATWIQLIRVTLGCVDFFANGQNVLNDATMSIASLLFDILLRSKVRDQECWDQVSRQLPRTHAVATQWGIAVVSLTRAVARLISQGTAPPVIHLHWAGVLENVRPTTLLIASADDIVFLWKQLCVLISPLKMKTMDAVHVAMTAVRDSTIILSTASYWPIGADHYATTGLCPPCSRYVPHGPSTSSLVRLWGDVVLHGALGAAVKATDDANDTSSADVRIAALQAACSLFLRRETEALATEHAYLDAFFNLVVDISEEGECDRGRELRGHALHWTTVASALNVALPREVVLALANTANYILNGPYDLQMRSAEDDDEDEAVDDMEELFLHAAVLHAANAVTVADILEIPTSVIRSVLASLLQCIECAGQSSKLLQQALCATILVIEHLTMSQRQQCDTEICEIASNVLAILRAPCGTYSKESLEAVLLFASWYSPLSEEQAVGCVRSLGVFCCSVRKLLEGSQVQDKTDVLVLSSLFYQGCRAIARAVDCTSSSLLAVDSAVHTLVQVGEAGLKGILNESALLIRDGGLLLAHVLETSRLWPFMSHTTGMNFGFTEGDYLQTASSVRCLAVGSTRIVTVIQLRRSSSPADGNLRDDAEVIIITRDWHGRRVWSLKRCGAALQPRFAATDDAVASEWICVENKDSLAGIGSQSRTMSLLDGWKSDAAIADLARHHDEAADINLADVVAPTGNDTRRAVPQSEPSQSSFLARQVCASLGLVGAQVAPLPVDATLIAHLKAIDATSCRDEYDVDVIYLHDRRGEADAEGCDVEVESRGVFNAFVSSIGIEDSASPGCRTSSSTFQCVRYWPKALDMEEFSKCEERDDAETSASSDIKVRIIWDALPHKFDWSAVRTAHHDLCSEISPQLELGRSSRSFDIVICPCPVVGVYSIRLNVPMQFLRSGRDLLDAVRWGAPLVHGCQLTAASLPRTVGLAVPNAVFQRAQENDYESSVHPRRVAIAAAASRATEALPSQQVVGFFL